MNEVLDESYWFVPAEASNDEVARAFNSNDPSLIRVAEHERYRELGDVVLRLFIWFGDRPASSSRMDADVLSGLFGYFGRRTGDESVLAAKHGLTVEQFRRREDEVLQAVRLRRVSAAELENC